MNYAPILYRIIPSLKITLVLMLLPIISLAQDPDNPCDGADPFADCPLDTWVIVLAVIALLAATFYLHRQQKIHTKIA